MQLPFGKIGKLLQLHSVRILVDVIKLQGVRRDDDDNSKKTENAFFVYRKSSLICKPSLGWNKKTSENFLEIQRSNIFRNTNNLQFMASLKWEGENQKFLTWNRCTNEGWFNLCLKLRIENIKKIIKVIFNDMHCSCVWT